MIHLTMHPAGQKAGRQAGATFDEQEAHRITGQKSFHLFELDWLTNQNKRYLPLLTAQILIVIRDLSLLYFKMASDGEDSGNSQKISFTKQMRKATREIHDVSDHLVNAKLGIGNSSCSIFISLSY
jgi:hypothetical protein